MKWDDGFPSILAGFNALPYLRVGKDFCARIGRVRAGSRLYLVGHFAEIAT